MFEFLLHVGTVAALYALLALSLNLQIGFAGLVNFGQILLFGCGMYGAGIAFDHHAGLFSQIVLGFILALLVALLFARLGRNLGSDYWGITTLSIAEIVRTVVTNESWLTGGAQGIGGLPQLFGGDLSGQIRTFVFSILVLGGCWFVFHRLTESKFGLSLRLLREQPLLTASLGYELNGLRRRVMLIAAIPSVLSGFLFAHYLTFVGPDQISSTETFVIWTMVVIGGIGSHAGVVLGAIVIEALYALVPFIKDLSHLSSEYVAALRLIITGGGLLAFLLLKPTGFISERVGGVRG